MNDPEYQALIYVRVSHEKRSISVDAQEKECRAVCDQKGWPVRAPVFKDDGISASRYGKERPGWAKLKAELRPGDILVVWDASRAQRDLEEFVALRNLCAGLGVPLSYSGRVYDFNRGDDRYYAGQDALNAERQSEQIKENVLRGKNFAASAGHPPGRAIWGYRSKPREVGTRADGRRGLLPPEWEHDPVEAPRVRQAVARILNGASLKSVYRWLEESDGYAPSSLTNLRRCLANPAIAGLRLHQGEVIGAGTWTGIITADERKDVLRELKRIKRNSPAPRGPEPRRLLTGIAKCAKCGSGVRWKRYPGPRSPGYECPKGHCSRVADAMDAKVEKVLFELLPQIVQAVENMPATDDDLGAEAAQAEIDSIEETLDEYTQQAIRRQITPGRFAEIEKGLRAQIAELEPLTIRPFYRMPDAQQIKDGWEYMTILERREKVREFLSITVVPAERRGTRTGKLLIGPGPFFDGMNPRIWTR